MNKEKFLAGIEFVVGSQNILYKWNTELNLIEYQDRFHAAAIPSRITDSGITVFATLLGQSVEVTVNWNEMTEVTV
jgi:hypothetical protein